MEFGFRETMERVATEKINCRYSESLISAKERQGKYKGTQRADHNSMKSILYNNIATTVQKGRDHATKEKALRATMWWVQAQCWSSPEY